MTAVEIASIMGAIVALLGFCVTGAIVVGKIGRLTGTLETSIGNQNIMIGDLKKDIGRLGDIITQLAVQSTRLDSMGTQIALLSTKVDELQHGEGFILPRPATNRN